MRRVALLVPLATAALALGACSTSTPQHHPAPAAQTTAVVPAPTHHVDPPSTSKPAPKQATVPTDLVGKTLGEAKAKLADLGFTHVVIGGGQVTDADKVASVPDAGKSLAADAKLVVVGEAPAPPPVKSAPAKPAPNSSGSQSSGQGGGYQLTCDLNAPIKTAPDNPNLIINRACGYTGSDGQSHSSDPWIEGQLEFDRCQSSGGHWDIPSQSCKH